jgi:hypothetical protein
MADVWIELSETQEARLKAIREVMTEETALEDMTHEQLKKYFADPPDYITPKERRGLKEIKRWANEALTDPAGAERERCLVQMFELCWVWTLLVSGSDELCVEV